MPDPELLQEARDSLETARERASDEDADRLASIADQLENALEAGRTLDHGKLARLQNSLSEIAETMEDAGPIDAARDSLSRYREDVEGV